MAVPTLFTERTRGGSGNWDSVRACAKAADSGSDRCGKRMIMRRPLRDGYHVTRILSVLGLLACHASAALGAKSITGTVRNQSRGEAAAGDDVVLLRIETG